MPGQKFELKPGEPLLKSQPSVLEKNVSISLKSVVFMILAVVLLSSSFLAGRYVFPSTVPIGSVFATINLGDNENVTVENATAETAEATTEEVTEATNESSEASTASTTDAVEADVPDEVVPVSDSVVTTYSNVKLEFTQVPRSKWYEAQGYGAINTIYYTITNNEAGTIKPSYFTVVIEGYSPNDRPPTTVSVPKNTAEIVAGKKVQNAIDKTSSGKSLSIAYSISQKGVDPANIKVTLELFDANKKSIAKAEQEFNLKG